MQKWAFLSLKIVILMKLLILYSLKMISVNGNVLEVISNHNFSEIVLYHNLVLDDGLNFRWQNDNVSKKHVLL